MTAKLLDSMRDLMREHFVGLSAALAKEFKLNAVSVEKFITNYQRVQIPDNHVVIVASLDGRQDLTGVFGHPRTVEKLRSMMHNNRGRPRRHSEYGFGWSVYTDRMAVVRKALDENKIKIHVPDDGSPEGQEIADHQKKAPAPAKKAPDSDNEESAPPKRPPAAKKASVQDADEDVALDADPEQPKAEKKAWADVESDDEEPTPKAKSKSKTKAVEKEAPVKKSGKAPAKKNKVAIPDSDDE
jgi:hypothetical protein